MQHCDACPSYQSPWQTVIKAQVEGDPKGHPVIFQPDAEFMAQTGVQIEDSILCPDDTGHILLTAINPAYDFQKLPPHTLIGQVESMTDAKPIPETPPGQDNNEHLILSVMGQKATPVPRGWQHCFLEDMVHHRDQRLSGYVLALSSTSLSN